MSFDQDPPFPSRPAELQTLVEPTIGLDDLPSTPQGTPSLRLAPIPLTPVRPRNMCHYPNIVRTMTPTKRMRASDEEGVAAVHQGEDLDGFSARVTPKRERQSQRLTDFLECSSSRPLQAICDGESCTADFSKDAIVANGRGVLPHLDLGLLRISKRLSRRQPCPPPPSKYETQFIELDHIGGGSFGTVYRVISRLDGQTSAIKQVSSKRPMAHRLREVAALQRCAGHPGVMRLHSHWTEGNTLFLQLECFEGGSIVQQFPVGSDHWTEWTLTRLLHQTAETLAAVHAEGLAHLDVKAENIYCRSQPGADEQFVLGDFGLACDVQACQQEDSVHQNDGEGDSRYLCRHLLNSVAYLTEADVFSLGATIYELARGTPLPTSGEEWHQIRSGVLPGLAAYSAAFQGTLQSMMAPDPRSRPSAADVARRCRRAEL
eukprot:EG_transcript_9441